VRERRWGERERLCSERETVRRERETLTVCLSLAIATIELSKRERHSVQGGVES